MTPKYPFAFSKTVEIAWCKLIKNFLLIPEGARTPFAPFRRPRSRQTPAQSSFVRLLPLLWQFRDSTADTAQLPPPLRSFLETPKSLFSPYPPNLGSLVCLLRQPEASLPKLPIWKHPALPGRLAIRICPLGGKFLPHRSAHQDI